MPLFTERVKLQLRDELFNALNQVNFNDPTTKAHQAHLPVFTGAGAGREIQLAAKLVCNHFELEKK